MKPYRHKAEPVLERDMALAKKEMCEEILRVLKEVGDAQGLTTKQISTRLGISPKSYYQFHNAKANPTLFTIAKIAAYAGKRVVIRFEDIQEVSDETQIDQRIDALEH